MKRSVRYVQVRLEIDHDDPQPYTVLWYYP